MTAKVIDRRAQANSVEHDDEDFVRFNDILFKRLGIDLIIPMLARSVTTSPGLMPNTIPPQIVSEPASPFIVSLLRFRGRSSIASKCLPRGR